MYARVRVQRRRWQLFLSVVFASVTIAGPSSRILAEDTSWPPSINGNAENTSDNLIDFPIVFPVAGPVNGTAGGTTAADGFCYNGQPRNYSTSHCISEPDAHKGQDFSTITPTSLNGTFSYLYTSQQLVPLLSPTNGLVTQSRCSSAGWVLEVRGGYNIEFGLWHMYASPLYANGSNILAGRRVGYVGGSGGGGGCTEVMYPTPHLHFEMQLPPGGPDASPNPSNVDPWISVRTAYARPGLWPSGTVDTLMRDLWIWFATANGISNVGYPSVNDSVGSNVRWEVAGSNLNNIAAVQYLANGTSVWDVTDARSGALVHSINGANAYWVRDGFFGKWLALGREDSFLGFPVGNDDGVRQNFQGGCVKKVSGVTYAAAYGSWPCV